jgi:hypothetical protein
VTGKREEYDIEGITDPEDIWGEDADPEFIEVSNRWLCVLWQCRKLVFQGSC